MVAQRKFTNPIIISTIIGDDHKLVIDLPPDSPTGQVQVKVEVETANGVTFNTDRERIRAKLLAAGKLSTAHHSAEGTECPPDEVWMEAGVMPAGTPSSEETLRELRGDD